MIWLGAGLSGRMIGARRIFDENPNADGPLGPKRPEDARQCLCLVFFEFSNVSPEKFDGD